MPRRKQVTIGRNAAGAGAAAREQRLRKFYVVGEHRRRQTFRRHGSVALELGRHSPHLPLLDLISEDDGKRPLVFSRTPAANLVPRRSGSGRIVPVPADRLWKWKGRREPGEREFLIAVAPMLIGSGECFADRAAERHCEEACFLESDR
jgi:hypothetical protein